MADKETNGDGRPVNLPGVYEHPETGKRLIARQHRKFGSAMADGFVQVGFKYVGPEPKAVPEKVAPKTEAVTPKAEQVATAPEVTTIKKEEK